MSTTQEQLENYRPYRELKESAEKNQGKLVLLVKRESLDLVKRMISYESDSLFNSPGIHHDSSLKLSILLGNLEFEEGEVMGNIIFPTKRYVGKDSSERWKLHKGVISFPVYNFLLGDGFFGFGERPASPRFLAFFGSEVESYFRGGDKEKLRMRPDISYVRALELLGLKAPEDLQKAYDTNISLKKINIMKKMESLLKDEPRSEETRNKIKQNLEEALELNMHRNYWEYKLHVALSIEVPKYIQKLCKVYGVEIK